MARICEEASPLFLGVGSGHRNPKPQHGPGPWQRRKGQEPAWTPAWKRRCASGV